ncbi:hypothetical protein [Pelagibius sp.]|uniref:hypothetical protein n=1 Tax=Pelagibius sp. TaxID=1931238 RepID=UPI003B4FFAEF
MLTLLAAPEALRAAPDLDDPDLDLNTRFIQGSFDILLPDGWVAALDESGTVLEAESPERHSVSIVARYERDDQLARARSYHMQRLTKDPNYDVEIFSDEWLLDDKLRLTVFNPSFTERSGMAELNNSPASPYQIVVLRRGDDRIPGLNAVLFVYEEDPGNPKWAEFLVTLVESVRIAKRPSRGGPLYQRVSGAPQFTAPENEDLIGSWRTRNIIGRATFKDTSPTDVTIVDAGVETLTLAAGGHYSSDWQSLFMALDDGDWINRDGEHRETGRWWLENGVLTLAPSTAEGRTFKDSKSKGDFLPATAQERRYEVTLRSGAPVLRGVCPMFAQMEYCKDLYSGSRRVLDFVLEPAD